jgi:tetratricopeptide (TPR) repeat protein
MIITPEITAEKEQLVKSPPKFRLEPIGDGPFGAVPATSVTNSKGSFDMEWADSSMEPALSRSEGILDAIVAKSKSEAERFSSDPQARVNYAVALMNRGRLDAAVDEFTAALELSPQSIMALSYLARIRTIQENFVEAQNIYEQLVKFYPQELSPLVNLSYVLFRTGRLDAATHVLGRAITLDPDAALPRYLMAVSQLRLSRPNEAIKHLRVAVRADVRSPSAYQALGVAYVMAGELKSAVRSFRAALTLSPDMREALLSLSNVLLQQGETKAVIDLISAHLQRHPSDVETRELLSQAYFNDKNYSAARQQLTSALPYVIGDAERDRKLRAKLLNNVGVCFDRQGDLDNTIQWVQRSLAVEQRFDSIPHLNLARLLLRKRQFDSALRTLDACKKLFPDNHEIPEVQSAVLFEQGRLDEAIQLLRDEVASGKATAGSFATLGFYLIDVDRIDEGCQVMTQGLKAYPQSSEIVNNLAYAHLMIGRSAEARSILTLTDINAKHIKPENHMALTATLGLLFLWEGDLVKGKQYYEHAEQMASELGRTDLVATVCQKMHLELARAFLRHDNLESAKLEITRGLEIEGGRPAFKKGLIALHDKIEHLDGK